MENIQKVQGSDLFFPWNRRFLWTFEEALRTIDPDVTIPYWDWSMTNTPEQSPVFDQDFCGGNGDPAYNMSVTSGMFSSWYVQYPTPHYLTRDFRGHVKVHSDNSNPGSTLLLNNDGLIPSLYVKEVIDSIIYNTTGMDHSKFRQLIATANGNVLNGIGGDMSQSYPSNDPLFYICLAFIDYIYFKYQQRGPLFSSQPNINVPMNPFGVNSQDVLDASGQLCYTYSDTPSYDLIKGYLKAMTEALPLEDEEDILEDMPTPTLTCTWIPITINATNANSTVINNSASTTCNQSCLIYPPSVSTSINSSYKSQLSFTEYYCTGYSSPCPCNSLSLSLQNASSPSTTNTSSYVFPSITPNMTKSCYYVFPNGSIPTTTPKFTTSLTTITSTVTSTNVKTRVTITSGVIVTVVNTVTNTLFPTTVRTLTKVVTSTKSANTATTSPTPSRTISKSTSTSALPSSTCVDLIQKFSCKSTTPNAAPNGLPSCDIPTLDPKVVMLCNGIVKSVDEAPLPNSTFTIEINWSNPLNVLNEQIQFLSGRLNGSTLCPLDTYDRNCTLLLRQPDTIPSDWIKNNGLNEGLVRMQEEVISNIYHFLNVETLKGAFLSVSNPVLQQKIINAYPSLCRGMPVNINREEIVVVNKTKIIRAPIPKIIVTNQTVLFDPLANITSTQLRQLPCQSINALLQQENPRNLSSMISSMLNEPFKPVSTCTTTLRVISSPTPLTPDTCKNIFGCGGSLSCQASSSSSDESPSFPPAISYPAKRP